MQSVTIIEGCVTLQLIPNIKLNTHEHIFVGYLAGKKNIRNIPIFLLVYFMSCISVIVYFLVYNSVIKQKCKPALILAIFLRMTLIFTQHIYKLLIHLQLFKKLAEFAAVIEYCNLCKFQPFNLLPNATQSPLKSCFKLEGQCIHLYLFTKVFQKGF